MKKLFTPANHPNRALKTLGRILTLSLAVLFLPGCAHTKTRVSYQDDLPWETIASLHNHRPNAADMQFHVAHVEIRF